LGRAAVNAVAVAAATTSRNDNPQPQISCRQPICAPRFDMADYMTLDQIDVRGARHAAQGLYREEAKIDWQMANSEWRVGSGADPCSLFAYSLFALIKELSAGNPVLHLGGVRRSTGL
jgi:hypothetical protein